MAETQDLKHHTRFDPKFHFLLSPVLLANVIVAIVVACHAAPGHRALHVWLVVVAVALFLLAGIAREYALANQDRIIRLEEHLRYSKLLTPEQAAAISGLSMKQIIALRFAPDAELPALASRAVKEGLEPKAIKQAIQNWRADNQRV